MNDQFTIKKRLWTTMRIWQCVLEASKIWQTHIYKMYMWWNTISLIVTHSLPFYLLYLDDAYDGSDTPPHKHTSTRFSVLFLSVRPRYSNFLFLSFFIHLFRGWRFLNFRESTQVHKRTRYRTFNFYYFFEHLCKEESETEIFILYIFSRRGHVSIWIYERDSYNHFVQSKHWFLDS